MQGTEELRAMEVRLLQTYRIPGKEMGSLELVTAFIKIGTERLSIQRSDVMQEESGIRDDQGHFPGTLTYSFVESLTSRKKPNAVLYRAPLAGHAGGFHVRHLPQ